MIFCGYKNHVKVDAKSKIIVKHEVTSAYANDSQALEILLDNKDAGEYFYGDSAYTGQNQQNVISQKDMIDKTCKKGCKNSPLNQQDQEVNKEKSKVRSRVEHVFGFRSCNVVLETAPKNHRV